MPSDLLEASVEEFEKLGLWWLPADQNQRVAGVLRFSREDGLGLSLIGSFEATQRFELREEYPVVQGLTQEGELITLCDCVTTKLGQPFSGVAHQSLAPRSAYIGGHYSDPQEARFREVAVSYSHLAEWVGRPGFHVEPTDELPGVGVRVTYSRPELAPAITAEGTVSVGFGLELEGGWPREPRFHETVWMVVEAREAVTVQQWLSMFIRPLQNLLSLATDRPNAICAIQAWPEHANKPTTWKPWVEVVFSGDFYEAGRGKLFSSADLVFSYNDVEREFSQVIQGWLEIADALGTVCDLFFGVQYSPVPMESEFLTAAQGLESYHRRRRENSEVPEEEHRQRVDSILTAVRNEHRDWLEEKLRYSNERTFRSRLKELVGMDGGGTWPWIADPDGFVQKVVDARNYYTHYDSALEGKAARDADLYVLCQQLHLLLKAQLLGELGFQTERCIEFIQKGSRYRRIAGVCRHE